MAIRLDDIGTQAVGRDAIPLYMPYSPHDYHSVDWRVRPASVSDREQIANLIQCKLHVHRHLDWREPLDWLGASPYLVAERNGRVGAALACLPEPPGDGYPAPAAWIRLFAASERLPLEQAWSGLWEAAQEALRADHPPRAAAIAMKEWLCDLLEASGFSIRQQIVMLERREGALPGPTNLPGVRIRPMVLRDLPAVAAVDAVSFDTLWRHSLAALRLAFQKAVLAAVAETAQGVIGFHISTQHPHGAHLARLAVRPEAQNRGVGRLLVCDLLRARARRGEARLTVNTQNDNYPSLALYRRLGFAETGERYPVFVFPIQ
jgi:ribosomal-protein-alanine N-acetyltransferase